MNQITIKPETMTTIITEIAKTLDIEIPTDERYERFFAARIIESVKANAKNAKLFVAHRDFIRMIVGGR